LSIRSSSDDFLKEVSFWITSSDDFLGTECLSFELEWFLVLSWRNRCSLRLPRWIHFLNLISWRFPRRILHLNHIFWRFPWNWMPLFVIEGHVVVVWRSEVHRCSPYWYSFQKVNGIIQKNMFVFLEYFFFFINLYIDFYSYSNRRNHQAWKKFLRFVFFFGNETCLGIAPPTWRASYGIWLFAKVTQ